MEEQLVKFRECRKKETHKNRLELLFFGRFGVVVGWPSLLLM